MRYMVREATQEKVLLQKEIDFLQSYIDLQLLRLSDNVKINFSVKGKPQNQQIVPLLLIPFVENVFKHGISYQKQSPIFIELIIEKNMVTLKTENLIKSHDESSPTGAGLQNTKMRLAYLYQDKHKLSINHKKEICYVELIIML